MNIATWIGWFTRTHNTAWSRWIRPAIIILCVWRSIPFITMLRTANGRANKLNGTYRLVEIKFNFSCWNGKIILAKIVNDFFFFILFVSFVILRYLFIVSSVQSGSFQLKYTFTSDSYCVYLVFFSIDSTRCSQSNWPSERMGAFVHVNEMKWIIARSRYFERRAKRDAHTLSISYVAHG